MYFEKEFIFLKKVFEKMNIKLNVINFDTIIDDNLNIAFQGIINLLDKSTRFCDYFPELNHRILYKVSDILSCHYIFIKMPEIEGDKIIIIGPYLMQDISHAKILEKAEKMNLNNQMLSRLEYYFSSVPVLRDEGHFFAMINTFCEHIWGGAESYSVADLDHDDTSLLVVERQEKTPSPDIDNNWKIDLMEKRYAYEEQLLNAVAKGQIHKAEQMMSSFSSIAFESRSNDDLRNFKNYSIIMNTLMRKAAQDGGVHPIHLDKISSDYAKRIEQGSSPHGVRQLMQQMLNDYCRLVRKHSINQYSSLVQRAIIKIQSDLTADLTLKKLAQLNNVSTSYFSTLFKTETGQTLTDYVNNQRISHAKHLLKTTNLQIQTIAQLCGILDLHYFCKLFKKYVGKTPKEYREIKTVI